ncbi:MAG: hypothetical protein KDA80_06255 [Planctomycetaceae bacterium]|nr:hypothetical protein [Planctomycetaceae bacterium]
MKTPLCVALVLTCLVPSILIAAETSDLIDLVQAIGHKGDGHPRAVKAARELAQAPSGDALEILAAIDNANPLAANWLAGAFQSVADRGVKSGDLKANDLKNFLGETSHAAMARTLAFEYLTKVDSDSGEQLIPQMLNDPAPALRRKGVAYHIDLAKKAEGDAALKQWKRALDGAIDEDHVEEIAKALKDAGEEIDTREHFGLIREWHVIGPFDNRDQKGFPVAYPPEKQVDLDAQYEGMKGEVTWELLSSDEDDGAFDLAKLTEPHKGAIDYAYTEFQSPDDLDVQFRLATPNAWKLWVNGQEVFAREEYHRGMRFDQYIVPGELKKGKNTILLKVCQNEQEQDWAQRWAFQFRIVDPSGRAVHEAK